MKQFSTTQPNDTPPIFNVSWKPFFLNVESPETSDVPIKVDTRRRERQAHSMLDPSLTVIFSIRKNSARLMSVVKTSSLYSSSSNR